MRDIARPGERDTSLDTAIFAHVRKSRIPGAERTAAAVSLPLAPHTNTRLRLSLQPSNNLDGKPRQRCPTIICTTSGEEGNTLVDIIRTDEETPHLNIDDQTVSLVDANDILSRVVDEQAWLRELHRLVIPGGHISLTLPASGPLAWLDARNIYRYINDVTRWGDPPDTTLPTGWNRHYHDDEARALVEGAGFEILAFERTGIGLPEIPQLAGLLVGNFLLGRRDTEMKLHPLRERMESLDQELTVPGIGANLYLFGYRKP